MTEQGKYSDWVDRYVRDELSDLEVIEFEEVLIEDIQLQGELEAVLVIKQALKLERDVNLASVESSAAPSGRNQWSRLAIAASVLLAITSTMFYWRSSIETGRLQQQISVLQAPRTALLNVPVNIMRTSGATTPELIVQKPSGHGVIVLDIELSAGFHNLEWIKFSLMTPAKTDVYSWTAEPGITGRSSVVLNTEGIPDGRINLNISDLSGQLQETRLLEFRQANP